MNKNKAQTFHLVHRSQRDPQYHDENATERVLVSAETLNKTARRLNRQTLDEEYGSTIRPNEGEAANYGIYFDDTEYDYMQHLRNIGNEDATWVEAPATRKTQDKQKKQQIQLRDQPSILPQEVLPSEVELERTYQDQQSVPDAISGFQPDMDPRLREVLEQLEHSDINDEETSDFDEEFEKLVASGKADESEFYAQPFVEEGEKDYDEAAAAKAGKSEWEIEFEKFKLEQKKQPDVASSDGDFSDEPESEERDEVPELVSSSKSKSKTKRKARTALSSVSMSSSALFRNEGLTLLDDRFDKVEEEYTPIKDERELIDPDQKDVFDLVNDNQFNDIMDEFLVSYGPTLGRKKAPSRMSNSKKKSSLEELDNVRKMLGRARI